MKEIYVFFMRATRDVSEQGRFCGIRALRQTFPQKYKKRRPRREKFWSFFFQTLLKTTISMKNLTQEWTQLGPFLQNQGFFLFSNKSREVSPPFSPPLVARLFLQVSIPIIPYKRSNSSKSYNSFAASFSRACKHFCHNTSCYAANPKTS